MAASDLGLKVVWVVGFKVVWLLVVSSLGFCSLIWDLSFVFGFSKNIRNSGLNFVFGCAWSLKIWV